MEEETQIKWQEWGEGAFQRARREDKPILLSISATWCHWCHVMDAESFAHPEVIRQINTHFIPVRVDSDRRPDINDRYNMGGWPTVVILTPTGEAITGSTYLPINQLLPLLTQACELYRHEKTKSVKERALSETRVGTKEIDNSVVREMGDILLKEFDPQFGGWMGPPKFPMPPVIDLALWLFLRKKEQKWLDMTTKTLDAMRESALYDPIEGGFFRYSASGDWDHPHYEKLLETNAGLLRNYLQVYQITGNEEYRATAQGILNYVLSTLTAEGDRWFYGSQDADSEYYGLEQVERLEIDGPAVDKTLYTGWNGLMISSLLAAASILEKDGLRGLALGVLDFLWTHCWMPQEGIAHYSDGAPHLPGLLMDQVFVMEALVDAAMVTGESHYLRLAEELMETMIHRLWDAETKAFFDIPRREDAIGALAQRIRPLKENARAAQVCMKLCFLTRQDKYRERASLLLASFSSIYQRFRLFAAPYALAVEMSLHPPVEVTVVGRREDPRWKRLVQAALRFTEPWKIILPLDSEADRDRVTERGYPLTQHPIAYLCVEKTCLPPVSRPEEFMKALENLSHLGMEDPTCWTDWRRKV